MNIYLDMDGVLADFFSAFAKKNKMTAKTAIKIIIMVIYFPYL